ncbi:fimbria/pilus outer membrane usher protein [Burkholderia multivorans]|uniref:fimbria/pilus outer membrane usher protein n=1 Tax=Burkholderia multivorans TaxID=87883 RepID=UPI00350FA3CE
MTLADRQARRSGRRADTPSEASYYTRLSLLVVVLGFATPTCAPKAAPVDGDSDGATALTYNFDSRLLLGTPLGVANIERFNRTLAADPGKYQVDLYVNDRFVSRHDIEFRNARNGDLHPCLSDALLTSAGVLIRNAADERASPAGRETDSSAGSEFGAVAGHPYEQAKQQRYVREMRPDHADAHPANASAPFCGPLSERVPGALTSFDLSRLRLDVTVPQIEMNVAPRGAVDPATLDVGETAAYVNYDTSYYTSSAYGIRSNSVYSGINAGMNVGLWRVRQQSSVTYNGGAGNSISRWNSIRTYAERPLIGLRSQLTVGQSFTSGSLFSTIGYTGVRLESDDRMLPDSMRGYAPVVNGVAQTNARVVVNQNGRVIYQTTVAPGPFRIGDLNPTSYQGDLNVEVYEANGQVSRFTVPFSAVPNSMRPGVSHYSVTLGQVRQVEGSNVKFADLTYQRGLTNAMTANGAVRVSPDYQSVLAGAVLGTRIGAFGWNTTWSHARDARGGWLNGWMSSVTYSHTFNPTQTTFSLAGYRYSTNGYREFIDALSARTAYRRGETWSSSTYQQRSQFTVNVNQDFGKYGSLSLSATASSYYESRPNDTQVQFSYNNRYRSISYNLSFVRQKTATVVMPDSGPMQNLLPGYWQIGADSRTSNVLMLTVSIPLGAGPRTASLSGSVTHDHDQGTSYQTSVSGIADTAQTLSYGLNLSGDTRNGAHTYSANVQKSLPMITTGASYSNGNHFWQAGATARGSIVAHRGGVTLGPYLGDTFGIVEAKGAEGATVRSGMGARVDRFGYAIVPSLTPYRFTDVALDTQGISSDAELTGNQVRVAPYAGAAVRLKFSTLIGHAVLIDGTRPDGTRLPLGASVLDGNGTSIGVVGQGGLAYARVPAQRGEVDIRWGKRREDQCVMHYDLPAHSAKIPIARIDAQCVPLTRE